MFDDFEIKGVSENYAHVVVNTNFDRESVPEFTKKIKPSILGMRDIVLEFAPKVKVDSCGVGAMIDLYRTVHSNGGRLALVYDDIKVLHQLENYRLEKFFDRISSSL